MTTQEIILTLTNYSTLFFNINILMIGVLVLYFNGRSFLFGNTIRRIIFFTLIASLYKNFSFFVAFDPWVSVIEFKQDLKSANMHFGSFLESLGVLSIACHVGVKSCKEMRESLLCKKEKIEKHLKLC